MLVVDAGSLLYSQNPVPPHLDAQEELKADLLDRASIRSDLQVGGASASARRTCRRAPTSVRLPRAGRERRPTPTTRPRRRTSSTVGGAKVGVFGVIARRRDRRPRRSTIRSRPARRRSPSCASGRAGRRRARAGVEQARCGRSSCATSAASTSRSPASAPTAPEPERVVDRGRQGRRRLARRFPANRGQVVSRARHHAARRRRPARRCGRRRRGAGEDRAARSSSSRRSTPTSRSSRPTKTPIRRSSPQKQTRARPARRAQHEAARRRSRSSCPRRAATSRSSRSASTRSSRAACRCRTRSRRTTSPPARRTSRPRRASRCRRPPKGKASYVGNEACGDCHHDAVDFWKTTVHAQAWKTLVDRGQQFDYDCIGCHVTGWEQAGRLEPRAQRQPARRAVRDLPRPRLDPRRQGRRGEAARGRSAARRGSVRDAVPHARSTPTRSSTRPYLRDIVGPGHGEELRTELGDGPTGHELRKAALDKAGRTLGAGLHAMKRLRSRRSRSSWSLRAVARSSRRTTAAEPHRTHRRAGRATRRWYGGEQHGGRPHRASASTRTR